MWYLGSSVVLVVWVGVFIARKHTFVNFRRESRNFYESRTKTLNSVVPTWIPCNTTNFTRPVSLRLQHTGVDVHLRVYQLESLYLSSHHPSSSTPVPAPAPPDPFPSTTRFKAKASSSLGTTGWRVVSRDLPTIKIFLVED